MLRAWFFPFIAGLLWAATMNSHAQSGWGFIPRPDWFGDPYLVTNPPGNSLSPFRVSLVLNPALVTNQDYQAKITALATTENPGQTADLAAQIFQNFRAGPAQLKSTGDTSAPSQRGQTVAVDSADGAIGFRLFIQRWLVFGLVGLFLARRGWRYFCEVEDDDDFANHLATLAVAHRWIFPVYMALLMAVAVVEFFQAGNLFLSLSVLLLASSLRGYYCESDFADFPKAQKIHLAMSLLLVGLGWGQGYDNYLSSLATWFHWHVFAWVMLALATVAFSQFYNKADFAEHRTELYFFMAGFLFFGLLGGAAGFYFWKTGPAESLWRCCLVGGILACLPLGGCFYRWNRRLSEQMVGRTIFDMIFSFGDFSEQTRRKKHLPEILLLRHWRDHGELEKAWQTAQAHLIKEERALPVWLFALETAVLYRRNPDDASKILKQLCVTEAFQYDHRTVAVAQVQGWMAAAGFKFDATAFKIERPPLQPTALTNKVEQKCREGRFGEAAIMLRELLEKDSLNEQAFVQLARLYAQDLKNRPAAEKLIADAADTFSPKLLDFLSRSLDEWIQSPTRSQARPKKVFGWLRRPKPVETGKISIVSPPITQTPAPPETTDHLAAYLERVKEAQGKPPDTSLVHDRVEKLLLERRLGSAVEIIKQQAEAQPENFEVWLRYAEAHGHHCGDPNSAEKIIRRMERSGHFKKAQMKKVHARLKKWRKKHATSQINW